MYELELIIRFILGIAFNIPMLIWIVKGRHLTWPGGIIAAGLIGIFIFVLHPVYWLILIIFFVTSSLLSKYKLQKKKEINLDFNKGVERDFAQVIANSIGVVVFGLLNTIYFGFLLINIFTPLTVALFTYLAVMTADTWGTEIGISFNAKVVSIKNLRKKIPPGTSGGISIPGTLGSFSGSFLIAFSSILGIILTFSLENLVINYSLILKALFLISFLGFLGSLIDSYLGSSYQIMYICPVCSKILETPTHQKCGGVSTTYYQGKKWVNNDMTNMLSGATASLLSLVFAYYLIL